MCDKNIKERIIKEVILDLEDIYKNNFKIIKCDENRNLLINDSNEYHSGKIMNSFYKNGLLFDYYYVSVLYTDKIDKFNSEDVIEFDCELEDIKNEKYFLIVLFYKKNYDLIGYIFKEN